MIAVIALIDRRLQIARITQIAQDLDGPNEYYRSPEL